jgi:hypothetical protein
MTAAEIDAGDLAALGLDKGIARLIERRESFTTRWLIGYRTKGGSYMLATPREQTDSGKARDLVLVLPGDLGHGMAVACYIAVNPKLVELVERIVSSS